ncbi:hypothetical protein A2U01_0033253, partial [Trifolium medium]|nr:hypothetical protein [Trifolium medium]
VTESAKRLMLFYYSLTGRAQDWLDTIPPNRMSKITWKLEWIWRCKLLERGKYNGEIDSDLQRLIDKVLSHLNHMDTNKGLLTEIVYTLFGLSHFGYN